MRFENKEGQKIPQVTWPIRKNNEWKKITTDDLFKDKTVILFALPGAFTPTCSSSHLPRYNELAPVFKQNGIDDILCLAVNDTFVMNAWAQDQEAHHITMIPDGNGEFTAGMGMLVDKNDLGFGMRSWRYSMLVKDSTIEKMFIEPDVPGDPFEVSDADTLLQYINPEAQPPKAATLFAKAGCPFCQKAKKMLKEAGINYEKIEISNHDITSRSLRAVTGKDTVPQIFIEGQYIGGSEELEKYLSQSQTTS